MAGGACVAGGEHGGGGGMHGIRSMSGRYASYWNAFLFDYSFSFRLKNIRVLEHI